MIIQNVPENIPINSLSLGQRSPHVYTITTSEKPIHVKFSYNKPYTQTRLHQFKVISQKQLEKPLRQSRRKPKIFQNHQKPTFKSVDTNKKRRSKIFSLAGEKNIQKSTLMNSHIQFVSDYNLHKSEISAAQTIVDRLDDFDQKQTLNPINKKIQNLKSKQKIKKNFHFPTNLFQGNGLFNNETSSFKTSLYSAGIPFQQTTNSPFYSPRNRIQSQVINIMCTPQKNRSISAHYLSKHSLQNNQIVKESIIISRQAGNSSLLKNNAILKKYPAITQIDQIKSNSTIIFPNSKGINQGNFYKTYNSKSHIQDSTYQQHLINYQNPSNTPKKRVTISFQPQNIKPIRQNIFQEQQELINNSFKNLNSPNEYYSNHQTNNISKLGYRTQKISNIIIPNNNSLFSTQNQENQGSVARFFDQSSLQTPRLPNILLKRSSYEITNALSNSLRKQKQQLRQQKRKQSLSMRQTQQSQQNDDENLTSNELELTNKKIQSNLQLSKQSSLNRLASSTASFYQDKKENIRQKRQKIQYWFVENNEKLMISLLVILGLSVLLIGMNGVQQN